MIQNFSLHVYQKNKMAKIYNDHCSFQKKLSLLGNSLEKIKVIGITLEFGKKNWLKIKKQKV